MKVVGKIQQVLPVESGVSKAGKDWQKQTLIVDNGDQYNPNVAISWFGEDKIKEVSKFKVGTEVEVSINLSSREYEGRWFNSIDGWKITANADFNKKSDSATGSDDLPF
jgi:hypothetical protein